MTALEDSKPYAQPASTPGPANWRKLPGAVIACWAIFVVLTAVCAIIMENFRAAQFMGSMRWSLETMVVSFLCALLALASIVGGLTGRNWVTSWLMAVSLACFHSAVMIAFMRESFLSAENWAICSLWPSLLLATCAPLFLLRLTLGWTLARTTEPAIARSRFSLEDLMIVGVVVACAMTFSQIMVEAEGRRNVGQLVMIMAVFAGVSSLCIPITVYVSFRFTSPVRRAVGWVILTALTLVVIYFSAAIVEGSLDRANDNLLYIGIGVPTGCLTVLAGILALRTSGYQLTYYAPAANAKSSASNIASAPAETQDPAGEKPAMTGDWLEDDQHSLKHLHPDLNVRRQARIATAIVVLVAAACGIGLQLRQQKAVGFYRQFAKNQVSGARIRSFIVSGLAFAPGFGDDDLASYLQHAGTIDQLSLAGTKVTDAILPKLDAFHSLKNLNLSRTNITSEGLLRWSAFARQGESNLSIRRLSLADSKVDWSKLSQEVQSVHFQHLDLSGLGITDEQLTKRIPATSLALARNPVTDAGINSLLENQEVRHLDLSDTQVSGSTLATSRCPADLNLDGTQITDDTLSAILQTGRVRKLSIARTKITAALLPLLSKVRHLRLGRGLITDDDLGQLAGTSFNELWLSDRQFTGACIANGGVTAKNINLSGSSVSDSLVIKLCSSTFPTSLKLADTAVSDQFAGRVFVSDCDVRNTAVTFDGISNRSALGTIRVSLYQFTPAELRQLSRVNVMVDDPSFSDSDDLW